MVKQEVVLYHSFYNRGRICSNNNMLYSDPLDETKSTWHTSDIWWADPHILWQYQCNQYFKESSDAFQDKAHANQVPFSQRTSFGQCCQVRICTNNKTTSIYLHQTSSNFNVQVSSSTVGHCLSSSLDSTSIFISFSLHQLQLLLQLLPASYPLPLMPKGEIYLGGEILLLGGAHPEGELVVSFHILVRGSSPWGGACCQLSSMTKGEIVGQFESFMICMVCLCLMFVIDVN